MAWKENAKTRRFALNMLKAGVAIFGAALLFACGDDDSSFVASENGGSAAEADIVVATFDYLPNCTDKREGKTAYIKDEKATYVCVDGDWITGSISKSVDDLLNCTSKHEGETVFVKEDKEIYVCTDGDWVVAGESGDDSDEGDDDGDDADKKSSSSTAKSADSKGKSSSSEGVGDASSSSSSRGFFEMSKDEYLNPKVSYGEMTDTRDNKTYKIVKIGDQVWMAENLNYADSTKTPSLKGKSWCYENAADSCAKYGRLYTWAAAIDSVALANDSDDPQTCCYGKTCTLPTVVQGVCPCGWHLPTYGEWRTLLEAVGGSSTAGEILKSGSGWFSNGNGTDTYGFSALPAGYSYGSGYFYYAGYYAYFWSASQGDYSYNAYCMFLGYSIELASLSYYGKGLGYSVRCLQN